MVKFEKVFDNHHEARKKKEKKKKKTLNLVTNHALVLAQKLRSMLHQFILEMCLESFKMSLQVSAILQRRCYHQNLARLNNVGT